MNLKCTIKQQIKIDTTINLIVVITFLDADHLSNQSLAQQAITLGLM